MVGMGEKNNNSEILSNEAFLGFFCLAWFFLFSEMGGNFRKYKIKKLSLNFSVVLITFDFIFEICPLNKGRLSMVMEETL